MSKHSNTNSTASYAYQTPPTTAAEQSYADTANADFHTPIVSAYGKAANDINSSVFENTLPPGVAEQIKSSRMFNLDQDKGAALGNASNQEAQFASGVKGTFAGMTDPQLTQIGGASQNVTSDPWGTVAQFGGG